jgi:hypothetical protein
MPLNTLSRCEDVLVASREYFLTQKMKKFSLIACSVASLFIVCAPANAQIFNNRAAEQRAQEILNELAQKCSASKPDSIPEIEFTFSQRDLVTNRALNELEEWGLFKGYSMTLTTQPDITYGINCRKVGELQQLLKKQQQQR